MSFPSMQQVFEACRDGNNDVIKSYFLSHPRANDTMFNYNYSYNMTMEAIEVSNTSTIELIFELSPKDKFFFSDVNINAFCKKSCDNNDIKTLKYLLNHPLIIKHKYPALVCKLASYCTSKGKLDILESIIDNFHTDSSLNEFLLSGDMTSLAAQYGHLNIIEYMYDHKILKEHNHIQIANEKAFERAAQSKNLDSLNYFIFEKNITISPAIQKLIDTEKFVSNIFEAKNLQESLPQNLNSGQNNHIIKRTKL
jgi:hypothetical protein